MRASTRAMSTNSEVSCSGESYAMSRAVLFGTGAVARVDVVADLGERLDDIVLHHKAVLTDCCLRPDVRLGASVLSC